MASWVKKSLIIPNFGARRVGLYLRNGHREGDGVGLRLHGIIDDDKLHAVDYGDQNGSYVGNEIVDHQHEYVHTSGGSYKQREIARCQSIYKGSTQAAGRNVEEKSKFLIEPPIPIIIDNNRISPKKVDHPVSELHRFFL